MAEIDFLIIIGGYLSVCGGVKVATVEVDTLHLAAHTSDHFLSVTIDAGVIGEHLDPVQNFTPPRLLNMARLLAPAVWRLGGTSEDYVIFNHSMNASQSRLDRDVAVLTANQWDKINGFSRDAGWHLIYGLNALLRTKEGRWDSTNAEQLLNYTSNKEYTVSWELGNEPDLFYEHSGPNVTASQLAKDFKTLRSILNRFPSLGKASESFHVKLAGPDTATLTRDNYFRDFLQELGDGVVDAVTWHQYYENGHTAKEKDFYNPDLLDGLIGSLAGARETAKKYSPSSEIWLGETSSAYGGGASNLSDTFIAGNLWLDKLGLAALNNYTTVCRQTFVGGNYALLDRDLHPLPDYFTSVLYKRLMSSKVLYVKGSLDRHRTVRVYAHCSNQTNYPNGHVTFIVINLTNETVQLKFPDTLTDQPLHLYLLTPGGDGIQSKQIMLNGKLLELDNDMVPSMPGKEIAAHTNIQFPSLTYGYVVADAKAEACM